MTDQLEPITSSSGSLTDTDFIMDQRMNEISREQLVNLIRRVASLSLTDTDVIIDQQMKAISGEQLLNSLRRRVAESKRLLESLEQYCYISETEIDYEYLGKQNVFEAVKDLYLTSNQRSRLIADRLIDLHRDALSEGESIDPECIPQFAEFFLAHQDFALPKITLTPDGTLRVRWIHGPGNFIAIEFTGKPLVKVLAEVPRDSEIARYFFSESAQKVASVATAIGASFS